MRAVGSILTGMPHFRRLIVPCAAICAMAMGGVWARADEIRLKDGQKLYGVIVAYEDNMFKVKTDFGFVLVEKDKIAAIIPSAPATKPAKAAEPLPAEKPAAAPKPAATKPAPVKTEVATPKPPASPVKKEERTAAPSTPPVENVKASAPPLAPKPAKPQSTRPVPAPPSITAATARPAASTIPVVTAISPASKPAAPAPPANRESLQGNVYTNYTHGFHMYKPPSWKLIEDAGKALPNAIVAMGTTDESTLLVVGQEKIHEKGKDSLEATANEVEKRLEDTYGNYRRISERKTVSGGFPAVEIHYRGLADNHDWSGTLLVVSRSGDMFSILGMTYADTDLIQIQENVIARAIASMEFNSN